MKRNLCWLFLGCCLFQAGAASANSANPSPFDGFYVGAEVGANQAVFDQSRSVNASAEGLANFTANQNFDARAIAPIGGLLAGWGMTFNKLYLGLRLNGDLSYPQKSTSQTITESIGNINLSSQTTAKLSNTYGATFVPGVLLSPNTLFYGLVGAEGSSLSVTSNNVSSIGGNSLTANGSERKEVVGIRAGLGVEQYLAHHISIGLEYDFTAYDSASTSTATVGSFGGIPYQANATAKVTPFTNALLANIEFHFA